MHGLDLAPEILDSNMTGFAMLQENGKAIFKKTIIQQNLAFQFEKQCFGSNEQMLSCGLRDLMQLKDVFRWEEIIQPCIACQIYLGQLSA